MRMVCLGTGAVNKQSCELSYEMAVVGVWRLFLDEGDCGSELSACWNCADRTLFVLHTPSNTEPGVCGLSDWVRFVRYFFTDQSGVIRYQEGAPASQISSAL